MSTSHFIDDMSLFADPMQLATGDREAVPPPSVQLDLMAPGIALNKAIYPPLPRIPGANISEDEAAQIDQLSHDAVWRYIEQHQLEQQILLSDIGQNAWSQNLPIRQIGCELTLLRRLPLASSMRLNFDQVGNEVPYQPPTPPYAEIDYSVTRFDPVAWDFQNGETGQLFPSANLTGTPFLPASAPFDVHSSSFGGLDMTTPAIDLSDFDLSSPLFGGPLDFPDFDTSSSSFGSPAMAAPVFDLPPFDPSSSPFGDPATAAPAPAPPTYHPPPLPYAGPAMTLPILPPQTFPAPPAPLKGSITTTPTTSPPRPKKQRKSRMPAPRPGGSIFQVDTPDTLREGRFAGDSSRNHAFKAGPGWSRDRFRTGPKEQAAAAAAVGDVSAAGRAPSSSRARKGKARARRG